MVQVLLVVDTQRAPLVLEEAFISDAFFFDGSKNFIITVCGSFSRGDI